MTTTDASMPTHLIRLGTAADLADLADIERAAARMFPADKAVDAEQTMSESVLLEAMQSGLLLVASSENQLVGFAVCREQRLYLHLAEVSVHPQAGRRGIGQSLVQHVIAESARRKLSGVSLTTFSDIQWNQPFYSKLGFVAPAETELPTHIRTALMEERKAGLEQRVGMVFNHDS